MKRASILCTICVTLLGLLVGCLPTYVGDPEKAVVDEKLVGIWHLKKDSEQVWVAYKMDSHCYLVHAYNVETEAGDKKKLENPMTYRAWLADLEGHKFVSLEVYAPSILIEPQGEETKHRYAVARYTLDDDKLTIHSVAPDFLKDKNISTPQHLEALIKDDVNAKGLYLDEMVYTRIDPAHPGDDAQLIELLKGGI